jgi:predicted ATPase/class 3 adenylate cyclase
VSCLSKRRIVTPPSDLSSRTYTFLFTDLEGSTQLWEGFPQAMKPALERHDAILRSAVETSNGQVVKTTGDGLMAFFASSVDGVNACLKAQRSLVDEPWGETGPLRVRMGMHVGDAQPRAGDYYGPAVNRAARLMSVAHGGQVLLSAVTAGLVADLLPEGASLRDLGEHRLRGLERPEHIFQLLHPDLLSDFPPLASLDFRPNNLPAQSTPLIGRETELAEIMERLNSEEVRLLTLTGPGGIGKTRLALQAAAGMIDRFDDGVYLVDLAPIRDLEAVPTAVAQALGLRGTSERPLLDDLKEQLRAKSMLLLLDNFEQIAAAAHMVLELLQTCPRLKVLVTSRVALHLRGEYVFPVPTLALPRGDHKQPTVEQLIENDAVQLFSERAQAVKHDFKLTRENAMSIAEICTRLDGLPLAIELAAARIRLFSPQALLDRLESRLEFLRGGARDLPARQQTLRDAIGWSFELLDTLEQRLFELLSVFPGGCLLGAVEATATGVETLDKTGMDIVDGVTSLLEKSLIRQADQEGGEPRLVMLETIREFAVERLEDDPEFSAATRRAHATYFADFTQRQWERMTGREREAALRELGSDIENVRTAWRYWVEQQNLEQLGKFVDGLWLLYDARGWYHAMVDLTNDLLAVLSTTPSTPEIVQQKILLQTSLARALLAIKGYTPEVEAAYKRALELCQEKGEIPQLFPVLRGLSSYYVYLGQFEKAAQMGEKILSLAERYDDRNMRVEGHLVFGYNLAFYKDLNEGLEHLEKAIAYYDPDEPYEHRFRIGSNPGVVAFNISAFFLWMLGFPDRALSRSNEAVALARRLNQPFSMCYSLFHAGMLHHWRRETDLVEDCAGAVLSIAEEHEYPVWTAVGTCLQGAALAGNGQPVEGLAQIRMGLDLYQELKTPPIFWSLLLYLYAKVCIQADIPEQGLSEFEKAAGVLNSGSGSGRTLAPEFFRLTGDLLLANDPGNVAKAELWFQQALDVARELQATMLELRAALSLSRLWWGQGKDEQASQLLRDIYNRFTEGFRTADLLEAKELLSMRNIV